MFGLLEGFLLTKLHSKRLREANFSLVLKLKHLHKLQLSACHRCYCLPSTNHVLHTVIKLYLMRKYLWFQPRIATLSEASRLLRDISECFVFQLFSRDFLLTCALVCCELMLQLQLSK